MERLQKTLFLFCTKNFIFVRHFLKRLSIIRHWLRFGGSDLCFSFFFRFQSFFLTYSEMEDPLSLAGEVTDLELAVGSAAPITTSTVSKSKKQKTSTTNDAPSIPPRKRKVIDDLSSTDNGSSTVTPAKDGRRKKDTTGNGTSTSDVEHHDDNNHNSSNAIVPEQFVWYSTDFKTPWPMAPSAFCIAPTEVKAIELFNNALQSRNFDSYEQHPFTLTKVSVKDLKMVFLADGSAPQRYVPGHDSS